MVTFCFKIEHIEHKYRILHLRDVDSTYNLLINQNKEVKTPITSLEKEQMSSKRNDFMTLRPHKKKHNNNVRRREVLGHDDNYALQLSVII